MLASRYERLSTRDRAFLDAELAHDCAYGAAALLFRAGPLARPDGGIDVAAIRRAIESRLHEIPRFRQKLAWVPIERQPVWIDDPGFDLDYHVRHTRAPFPGGDAELKQLVGRLLAHRLDRSRPLWEIWVIEGLEGERFALFQKQHHCLIDAEACVDPLQLLLSVRPDQEVLPPPRYMPRPVPSKARLFWDASWRRAGLPRRLAHGVAELARSTAARGALLERARDLRDAVRAPGARVSETPLNPRIGPHRRVDWWSIPLAHVAAVRRALGVALNDVLLATIAGAVRSFMLLRSIDPAQLRFQVALPVRVAAGRDPEGPRGRLSLWIVDLPIGEADALARLEAIREQTRERVTTTRPVAAAALVDVREWVGTRLLSQAAQLALGARPHNLMIANVPGPRVPLYACGAELLEAHGLVPLLENTALGIAVMSYNGRLSWGFDADWELVPDLSALVAATAASFRALQDARRG